MNVLFAPRGILPICVYLKNVKLIEWDLRHCGILTKVNYCVKIRS
jgi:hypothetical protein